MTNRTGERDGGRDDAVPVSVLHALMTRVHLSGNVQETLDAVTQGVLEVTGFGIAAISVVRGDRLAEVVSVAGSEDARSVLLGSTTPVWDIEVPDQRHEQWGLFRFVSHEHFRGVDGPILLPRPAGTRGPDAWHPYDELVAPLNDLRGELMGFLHVDEPPGGRRPDATVLQRLDILAVQAGLALRAQRDRDELEAQVRLARLGHRLPVAAARAADLDALAREVVELVCEEVQVDLVALRLVESEAELPVGLWTTHDDGPPALLATLRRTAEHIARDAWERREVVAISLDKPDPTLAPEVDVKRLASAVLDWGMSTVLLAPVGADQAFLGYFVLMRRHPHASWTPAECKAVRESSRDFGTVALSRALLTRSRGYVARLREIDEQKRVMFATVAHEFKGPITAIAGNAELLADELAESEVGEPTRSAVAAIARNARRLDDLVADLMALQEADDPERPRRRGSVDLWAAVREAVDVWRVQAEHKLVRLGAVPPVEPVRVAGQRSDVFRIVVNLVSNAVKYSAAGGAVRLRVEVDGDHAKFVCADDGPGIGAEDLDGIFDEFVRGSDPASLAEPGTGLGLSIVRRLTDELGGTVTVESEPGRGSTFIVALPRADLPPG